MKLRRTIAGLHKWIGLSIAVFVALQCLTGLLLVYEADIVAMALHRDTRPPDARQAPFAASDVERLLETVRQRHDEFRVSRIDFPVRAGYPFLVYLEGMGPGSGHRLVSAVARPGGFELEESRVANALAFVFDWHHTLLGGATGSYLVGTLGVALLLMTVSGFTVWWPGLRRLRGSLKISARRHPVTFIWQLHRAAGVLALPVIAVTLISGTLLAFQPLLKELFAGAAPVAAEADRRQVSVCTPGGATERLATAMAVFPDQPVRDIRFSADGASLERVLFVNRTRTGLGAPHQVWLDPCEPVVRKFLHADQVRSTRDAVLAWLYPVHTGVAFGRSGQAAALLGGSLLGGILATGILLWSRRRRSRRDSARRRGPSR